MPASDNDREETQDAPSALTDQIEQNIEGIVELNRREWGSVSAAQRRVEIMGRILSRPAYLVVLLIAIALWVGINLGAHFGGRAPWDPPPFEGLDAVMTFIALLTTTIVLVSQNRQTKVEQQHAHLDLQVNLLTEQKVTKVIHLLEELRRDLPMVKDRRDPQVEALREQADTAEVLTAIEGGGLTGERKGEEGSAGD